MSRFQSIVLVAPILLAACGDEQRVEQLGYFKSPVRDRVFTARMAPDASQEDVRDWAENRAHTEGHMTAVYVYAADAKIPADEITLARNVIEANQILDETSFSAWRYAYMRYRTGVIEFADCAESKSSLCRTVP